MKGDKMQVPYRDWKPELSEVMVEKALEALKLELSYGGEDTVLLEKELSAFCESTYGVCSTSGSTAQYLAMQALGIGDGDEVVMPANAYGGVVNVAMTLGARPVFAEIDEDTSNIAPDALEDVITDRTKAIVVLHYYALPADMDPIMQTASKSGIPVIEDCCQTLGARYKGARVGSIGTCGFTSFSRKIVNSFGGGGMVYTDDEELARRMLLLRGQGRRPEARGDVIDWYDQVMVGSNLKLAEVMVAIVRTEIDKIDDWNRKRHENAKMYSALFGKAALPIQLPFEPAWAEPAYCHYVIKVPSNSRRELMQYLYSQGIEAKCHYPKASHEQLPVEEAGGCKTGDFPIAERDASRVMSLPVGLHMTPDKIRYVVDKVEEYFKKAG